MFLQCNPSVRSQTSDDAKALRQKLFVTNGYDKKIRPSLDQIRATGKNLDLAPLLSRHRAYGIGL